jgi:glycosyltransferase involved in cell wall biosynthesis
MRARIAYLVAARSDPQLAAAVAAGVRPCPEFLRFVERNAATLLTLLDAEAGDARLARLFRLCRQPYWALAATALAQRENFDCFLASGEDLGIPLALLARARGVRQPIHIITHGSFLGSPKLKLAMRLVRGLDNVHYLCLAETLRRLLIDEYGVAASHVHDTAYAADTRFFQPIELPAPPPVVVSVGTANRDYRTLVAAAVDLGVHVSIAADSAWFPERLDISDASLPTNVDVRSYDYRSLRELYAAALLAVVPLYPGRSPGHTAVVEAMAMGKAVIVTRTATHGDYIVDGETGYYVRCGDVADLRAKMTYLIEHPAEARRMGERARARAEALYSLEAYCQRMERVVEAARIGVLRRTNVSSDSETRRSRRSSA